MEKRYPTAEAERAMQELWAREDVYRFDPDRPGALYSIDTPPPTVSGSLHIGHIFSYTQAEMMARYKRMRGCNVFYPFGFDDNGLPTERLVEREEGVLARDLPRSVFTEKCLAVAGEYEARFRRLWQSLGFSVDWSLQYTTNSPLVRRISQRSFLDLVRQGKAYCKESPVLWCTHCGTSIAQAELDVKEIESSFHYLPFRAGDTVLEVATTRPELLFGCVCLFVHPDDPRYARLIGGEATAPLYGYAIPILADDKVGMDQGTGVVMCATFGDSTDAAWFEQHRLPYRRVLLPDGRMAPEVPGLAGLTVPEARREIVRQLSAAGLLLRSERLTHAVGVHERCGSEIEILPSRQWYIDVLTEKQRFLDAADEISWHPAHMKARYTAWVEGLKWDWCISRQRYFGVPIPVWYCADCGKPVFAAPDALPVNPLETPYIGVCDACGCTVFHPESAVFDTWATSSVSPLINAHAGEPDDRSEWLLPMSMRTQAHEIIRTWAFYTIVKSLYHTGRVPWKDLMICGFVLAKKGEKISKSKGNAPLSPSALIAEHSADVLRYWAASARLGTDTFFSPEDLAVAHRFVTKLWNAARFSIAHLQDFDPSAPPPALPPVDRWMRARVDEATARAADALDQYEIGAARHELDALFWSDFCDNYLELVKERLYEPAKRGAEARRAAQYTLYHTLLSLLKLYAIYVPHVTEYIYQQFFRAHEESVSLHLLQWRLADPPDPLLLAFGGQLKAAVGGMRRLKSERSLSMKAPLDRLEVRAAADTLDWFTQTRQDLAACAQAAEVVFRVG